MPEIICYTTYLPEGTKLNISFFELLLDENLANGVIVCPTEVYSKVGTLNTKLKAKQNYEFLLRALLEYPVTIIGSSPSYDASKSDAADIIFPSESASLWDEFCTDCYIAGKYSKELRENNLFNAVVGTLLGIIPSLPDSNAGTKQLEMMLSHAPEFYEIDDDTRPILIYRGDDTCYNQLNAFADELAKAIATCKQRIEIFDVAKEGLSALIRYKGQRFKAIVGIQTYLFSVKMQDKTTNLHDLIIGPKFNMILDHPVLLKDHITSGPKDYYLLLHDRNYINFAKKHYKNIKDCFFFSPAGIQGAPLLSDIQKKYDVSFIGTYYNYRTIIAGIKTLDKKIRYIANRFLIELRRDVNAPAEKALEKVLEHYQMQLTDDEFLEMLFDLRYVFFGVMYYYREKVIRTLLDGGIEIHVYGNSWNTSPFAKCEKLIINAQLSGDEVLEVMAHSRISLNIMAWHKDGFTERIANSMLNGSVVVSDTSTQLNELFTNGEDLILFDLNALEALTYTIRNLLTSKDDLSRIGLNGYETAFQNHLWDNRAKQLLDILNYLDSSI